MPKHFIIDNRLFPYLVTLLGIAISTLIWLHLTHLGLSLHTFDSLASSLPWIILIAGGLLSIVLGISIRLVQLTREKEKTYAEINENFQNEITERIRSEETKQQLEKALLQGQKLQAIGTLAGGIAHDFNNILYAIIGYVEMARDDVQKDTLVHKNLGKVLEASHRGQELISRILTFSRRQQHDFTSLHVKSTLENVLSLLRPAIPSSVMINLKNTSEDYVILGNQTQLHQVIVNLINNAVDAMDGEGTITIQISQISHNDPLLKQFPKINDSNYCKIDIGDTGHGMDVTTIGRIFEPFYTTKEVGKGTGLGLATVHAIIKEHQGEVLVSSQLGHGTTFTLLLPEHKETSDG